MIDAAKSIMAGAREVAGTDSVFYEKTGEVLKRADQKVLRKTALYINSFCVAHGKS